MKANIAETLSEFEQDINASVKKSNVIAGKAGSTSATSGSTIKIPYIQVSAGGGIDKYGEITHTVIPGGSLYIT